MAIKSPFPGFDPYLEHHWGDVHHSLIQYSRDALQGGLPDDLVSRVEERVYVENHLAVIRSIVPDAHISEWRPEGGADGGVAVATETEILVADSLEYELFEETITEGFIEIRELSGGKVVTVIEFLSPANKAGGEGTARYRKKQAEILASPTSLVEIDWVRAGRRIFAVDESQIPPRWQHDGLASIRLGWEATRGRLYHFPIRERLKALPIPLRKNEKPILLDLQAIHDECYQKGRYDRIDYTSPVRPPLAPGDAEWAEQIARSRSTPPTATNSS